jgi:beta-N-acetylhexosaminidase
LSGTTLGDAERRLLAEARPAGLILFARNCTDPTQVRALVDDARAAIAAPALVLIDQEGGRVRRLRPPHWRDLPPAAAYAALHERDSELACCAARLSARLTAADLLALGIDTNCAPVLDVPVPGAHDIIGDRAYGRTVPVIVALGRAVAEGYLAGGVLPVIKHIPGHGRATADSHLELPVVSTPRSELDATDFAPFRALADMPVAMTAHVVYCDIDAERPASTSPHVVGDVIRRDIGFDGLLMCDDLGMRALSGTVRERTAAVMVAGCDLALHCSGILAEMEEALAALPALSAKAADRLDHAFSLTGKASDFDVADAEALLAKALAIA